MSKNSSLTKLLLNKEKEGYGKYSPVSDGDEVDSQASTLDIEPHLRWERRNKLASVLPWVLVAVFASLSVVLLAINLLYIPKICRVQNEASLWGTFGNGLKTDFRKFDLV